MDRIEGLFKEGLPDTPHKPPKTVLKDLICRHSYNINMPLFH